MKFYQINESTIEFARNIIKNVLSLKYLDQICREVNISCEVSFVDDTGNQHTAKRYGIGNVNMELILMYEHFMFNVINGKEIVSSHLKITRNIKLCPLITNLMRKNLFIALPINYCYTNVEITPLKVSDYNCKLIKDISTYGKYKESYELINNLLLGSYNYHGRLKQMIKEASYGPILFHVKGNFDEPVMELDVNGL
jgi:hypothetical protein